MAIERLMTVEELWVMPDTPGMRHELAAGKLVELLPSVALNSLITAHVYKFVRDATREHRLGLAFPDGVGYILQRHPDVLRIPDVSFVSWERLPGQRVSEGFCPVAPDLAVEIVSPYDRPNELTDKVRDYLAGGTKFVWVLHPRQQSVTVHTPDGGVRQPGPDDYLDGGDVLPDFRVRVADLFAVKTKKTLA